MIRVKVLLFFLLYSVLPCCFRYSSLAKLMETLRECMVIVNAVKYKIVIIIYNNCYFT